MLRFDLTLLVPLDALLHEKSVTAAGERVGVTQSTMSGMLKRLREQLHDPLIVRIGRTFKLTPRAEELAPQVRQMLLNADSLFRPRETDLSLVERHIRIMASEYSLLLILPHLFRAAAAEAPLLTFEVVAIDDPAERVYSGEVDLSLTGNIISFIDGDAANIIRTSIVVTDSYVGLVDDAHPLSGDITLDEFLSYPHVATQFAGIPQTVEETGLFTLSRRYPPRIRIPSFIGIGTVVRGTEMIGICPSRLVPMLPAAWGLRTLTLPGNFPLGETRALWHSRFDGDPVHIWLRDTLSRLDAERTDGIS